MRTYKTYVATYSTRIKGTEEWEDHNIEFQFYGKRDDNLFYKAGLLVIDDMMSKRFSNGGKYKIDGDLPNVWRNGCVGSLWIELEKANDFVDKYVNISITSKWNGAIVAA